MTTEHPGITCTGNPDPEPVPAHTCQRGPLCGAWPEDGNPDPGPLYGCEHGSCLAMVNENCEGCRYAAWLAEDSYRREFGVPEPGMRDAYEQEAATYAREHGLGAYATVRRRLSARHTCALVCRKQGRR